MCVDVTNICRDCSIIVNPADDHAMPLLIPGIPLLHQCHPLKKDVSLRPRPRESLDAMILDTFIMWQVSNLIQSALRSLG